MNLFHLLQRIPLYGRGLGMPHPNIILGNLSVQTTRAVVDSKFPDLLSFTFVALQLPSPALLSETVNLVSLADQSLSSLHSFPHYSVASLQFIAFAYSIHHSSIGTTFLGNENPLMNYYISSLIPTTVFLSLSLLLDHLLADSHTKIGS